MSDTSIIIDSYTEWVETSDGRLVNEDERCISDEELEDLDRILNMKPFNDEDWIGSSNIFSEDF